MFTGEIRERENVGVIELPLIRRVYGLNHAFFVLRASPGCHTPWPPLL